MEEKTFEIIPVRDNDTGVFSIKDYDLLIEHITSWVNEFDPTGKINTKEDFDFYLKDKPKTKDEPYSIRATASSLKDLVSTIRKGIISDVMGTFEEQAKNIEKLLGEFDKKCKEEKEKYLREKEGKIEKQKIITLTVKSYDQKVIEKVKNFAISKGCEVKL